jgi:hypothetical protein
MAEAPAYAIVGRGRWAAMMQRILAAEGRRVISINVTRKAPAESGEDYKLRLSDTLKSSGARIAWICVPPGAHVPPMIEATLDAGLHAVAEKPWLSSRAEGKSLLTLAHERHLLVAMHYQYCFLEGVEKWRREMQGGDDFRFGGRFVLSRADHLGISALDNLGSHLLAIRRYAVLRAAVGEIYCAYEQPDERNVWLESQGARVSYIDFFRSPEPLIQRFLARFESALGSGEFPLDLKFALDVAEDVRAAE